MNVKRAEGVVNRILQAPEQKLGAQDPRVSGVLTLVDRDGDQQADRTELRDALVQGSIKASGKKFVPAQAVSLPATPQTPGTTPADYGLVGKHWAQGGLLPGGDPANPPLSTRVKGRGSTDATLTSSLTNDEALALHQQDFNTVAASLTTPEDVAYFLGTIEYDDARADEGQGPSAAYSSEETLARDTGVCRDQHTLARDILLENGYEAVTYGYSASNQSHAVTMYQDPATGYWGVIEYGKIFQPSELKAHSPEEALLMIRPSTLVIRKYDSNGPDQRTGVDGLVYTEAARVYERFLAGPAPEAGNSGVISNQAFQMNMASPDGQWQGQFQIVTDPKLPYLKDAAMAGVWRNFDDNHFRVGVSAGIVPNNTHHGVGSQRPVVQSLKFVAASAEEHHPDLLRADNLGGSGLNVSLSSHTTAQGLIAFTKPEKEDDKPTDSATMDLNTVKTNPELQIDRTLPGGHTRVHANYGANVNAYLLYEHWDRGGQGFPIDQYATLGVDHEIAPNVVVSAQGYVPISNHTNDFAAEPRARLSVASPYWEIGTTQGLKWASYDGAAGIPGVKFGPHDPVDVSVYGVLDHDRQSRQAKGYVGLQLTATQPVKKH